MRPSEDTDRALVQKAWGEIATELQLVLDKHRQLHATTGFPRMGSYLVLYALTELLGAYMKALIEAEPEAHARCAQMLQQLALHIGPSSTLPVQ